MWRRFTNRTSPPPLLGLPGASSRRAWSTPGAPRRGGGLPASKPGLVAGAHDRAITVGQRQRARQRDSPGAGDGPGRRKDHGRSARFSGSRRGPRPGVPLPVTHGQRDGDDAPGAHPHEALRFVNGSQLPSPYGLSGHADERRADRLHVPRGPPATCREVNHSPAREWPYPDLSIAGLRPSPGPRINPSMSLRRSVDGDVRDGRQFHGRSSLRAGVVLRYDPTAAPISSVVHSSAAEWARLKQVIYTLPARCSGERIRTLTRSVT
jgi:hypothetical protein